MSKREAKEIVLTFLTLLAFIAMTGCVFDINVGASMVAYTIIFTFLLTISGVFFYLKRGAKRKKEREGGPPC